MNFLCTLNLKDETEAAIKEENKSFNWGIIIFIIFGLGICALLFYLFRKYGIDLLIKRGKDPKLVDQESFDDSFNPTSNNHP